MKNNKNIAIIGGGPSGLIAAEKLAEHSYGVTVYERMPTVGRKFLMAGRGGLNLTHSENLESFFKRYAEAENWLAPYIKKFTPEELVKWANSHGEETFVGSSGRVFPKKMKASPLLRAWLKKLNELGVIIKTSHTFVGFDGDKLKLTNQKKETFSVKADAVLLALGGGSWPRLGSDGSWVNILSKENIKIKKLEPANCGFIANWSEYFSKKFAGTPLKNIKIHLSGSSAHGELMVTKTGLEGGSIYALSSKLREEINLNKSAVIKIDLRPNVEISALTKKLELRKKGESFSTYLKKAGFSDVTINLLYETQEKEVLVKKDASELAKLIKNLPVKLVATSGMARAISSAGGIVKNEVDKNFMLIKKPGVFVAGEMLDWEAPTGGYLLQACFSTGIAAANGIIKYLEN